MFMNAFHRLSTCRQVGMGLGPIPWTVIGEYARVQELDQEHTDMLYYHVEALDAEFLKWSAKQNEPKDRHSDK